MKKPNGTINAKSILTDMKAGMSDSALIEKYKLSAAGLESLLRKLRESDAIRRMIADEIVQDAKQGVLDDKKYDFFFNEVPDARGRSSESVISGRELIRDLGSGMSRWELILKYRLSSEQLKKMFEVVLEQRRKIATSIAEDVRSGTKGPELMKKYQLSHSALRSICQELLTEGVLGSADFMGIKRSPNDDTPVHQERREIPRRIPSMQITVRDIKNENTKGTVKDITEKGLAVRGIKAEIGESKSFAILGDEIGIIDPFELSAECRWVGIDDSDGQTVAGFMVTAISDRDLQSLQELISILDLDWKGSHDNFKKKN